MDPKNYDIEDFCQDLSFWKWIKYGDAESKLFWEKWLEQHPDKRPAVAQAKKILQSINIDQKEPDERNITTLWHEIDNKIASSEKIRRIGQRKKRPFTISRVAAIFIGFVIGVIGLYTLTKFNGIEKSSVGQEIKMIERANPAGRNSTITLPDGTRIRLNAASTLIFPEVFSAKTRQVSLIGEAFFQVAKDPSKPFIIHTGRFSTTVLGTSFNINAYPSTDEIKVAVVTGKVFVEDMEGTGARKSLTITPEEMAVFNKGSGDLSSHAYDYLKEIAWKDNIIHFENADMEAIIDKLAKWYGVTFILNKHIPSKKDYTATYDNKSLEEVLQGLSFAFDFEFTIENKVVTIN